MSTATHRQQDFHAERWRPEAGTRPARDRSDEESWRDAAACRRADPELFFPIAKSGPALTDIQRAKAICAACPVRQPCLAFALATGQEFGIWGGYDEDERRWLRHRDAPVPPTAATP